MLEYDKKRQGAFFTSGDIAHYLTRRVVENENQEILEPSFGDGSFVDAIIDLYCEMGWKKSLKKNIHAVEIREDAIAQYNSNPFVDFENFIPGDFLSVEPFPVDVVIGNPPYVGLNK
ncbi:MAG: hypothetical protein QG637_681, partial [Chloroflexota bacterium]|nr:hypothetical protein [Chloroflexota bacterium]